MHPQTIDGHVVATAENFTGLLLFAVMTGLVFARFARPRARIIFARYPVVTQHNGMSTLIFRMANARSNFITEAAAKLWMLRPAVSKEGKQLVGFERMRLIKSENPTFALSWTLSIRSTSKVHCSGRMRTRSPRARTTLSSACRL
jgi:inward rectifier potassium channel